MKKRAFLLLMVLSLTVVMITGCGNGKPQEDGKNNEEYQKIEGNEDKEFEEIDGIMVYTDTSNSPFEDSGLKISIKEGEDGFAEFMITDKEGKETVNYYKFDFNENIVEKFNYVSAMGTAFYYYYDLNERELIKIEDGDHEDTTESTKEAGRWEGAAEKINEEVESLEDYFKIQYNKTIEEAVNGK